MLSYFFGTRRPDSTRLGDVANVKPPGNLVSSSSCSNEEEEEEAYLERNANELAQTSSQAFNRGESGVDSLARLESLERRSK